MKSKEQRLRYGVLIEKVLISFIFYIHYYGTDNNTQMLKHMVNSKYYYNQKYKCVKVINLWCVNLIIVLNVSHLDRANLNIITQFCDSGMSFI